MKLNQIKTGAILSYASIFVNNIVGLLYTPFMLRMMGQNEYGLYSLVASVVAYLTVLDLGFNNAIVRYTAKYRAEEKIEEQYKMFGMFFIMYSIISLVVLIIGLGLYCNLENLFERTMTPDDLHKIKVMFVLLILNVAYTFPMSVWGGIITAYEDFVFQKLLNLARVILNPICMIVLLCMGYRAIAMVVVTTIFNVITLAANAVYCKKVIKIKVKFGKFEWGIFREVLAYSIWIFLCAIVDRLYWSSGQFILGMYISAVQIAVFAVAVQIQAFYGSFSFAISSVLLPRVVNIVVKSQDSREISSFFTRIGRLLTYPMLLILCGFILFGKKFVVLWAGEDYTSAYYMALCFIVPELFTAIQQMGYSVLQAQNKVKFRAISQLVVSVIAVLLCIPLAKFWGGLGCALGIGLGIFIGNVVIINIYYQRQAGLDMHFFWRNTLRMMIYPLILTILYGLLLYRFPPRSLTIYLVHICVFSILYILGSIKLNFNEYESDLLLTPILSKFRNE